MGPLLSRKRRKRVESTAALTDPPQVNLPSDSTKPQEEMGGGTRVQIGDVKIPPRKAAGFIASYQKRMHEAVYYRSVY